MRSTSERRLEIRDLISQRRYTTVGQLAQEFGVNYSTIRRDLEALSATTSFYYSKGTGGGIHACEGWYASRHYFFPEQEAFLKTIQDGLQTDEDRKMMEGIDYELEMKAEGYVKIIRMLNGEIGTIENEVDRLSARKKALVANINRLKGAREQSMILLNKKKFKTLLLSFDIQKNPPSVNITGDVPEEFLIPQKPKVDKRGIIEYVKEYGNTKYAELTQSESLRIRYRGIMANLIGIAGDPGSGKSTSLKNLPPDQTVYIDSDCKRLNWKGWKKVYSQDKNNYFRINEPEKVIKALQSVATNEKFRHVKYVVVDTVNNLMISEEMRRCKEKGYDKWMDLAQEIWQLVELPGKYRDDLTVILLFHTQTEHTDDGYERIRIKTNGRKTEKNDIDSKFNWLLRTVKQGDKYLFEVTSHNSTSRTPLDAFEDEHIPNDIMRVLEGMKEY